MNIVNTLIPEGELFSTGFTQIMTSDNAPREDIEKVVLVAVIGY